MAIFERHNGEHLAARVRTFDDKEIAKHRRLVEDGTDGWREVDAQDSEPAKLTPKQRLQAEARSFGLDDSGTADEIKERIDAHHALVKQAEELELSTEGSDEELQARIDAKLAE